jgi:hypothetical protein
LSFFQLPATVPAAHPHDHMENEGKLVISKRQDHKAPLASCSRVYGCSKFAGILPPHATFRPAVGCSFRGNAIATKIYFLRRWDVSSTGPSPSRVLVA